MFLQFNIINMRLQKFFFFLILLASMLTSCVSAAQQPVNLSVTEFEKGIKQKNIQVLDVRTPGEYQNGYIKNALLADWMNQADFTQKVKSLDKKKAIYTYCMVGGRSAEATKWLISNGFTVYNLQGGISAWGKAGKPIEPGKN